jgi:hypothetical protein
MSVPKTALTEGETFQLRKAKRNQAVDEWTLPLDTFLKECVVRNYFNFDMVAIELNQEAKRIGHDLGAARTGGGGIFTADKCRSRWSYLHLLVSLFLSQSTCDSENKESKSSTTNRLFRTKKARVKTTKLSRFPRGSNRSMLKRTKASTSPNLPRSKHLSRKKPLKRPDLRLLGL